MSLFAQRQQWSGGIEEPAQDLSTDDREQTNDFSA
jgi:hypothetical protein